MFSSSPGAAPGSPEPKLSQLLAYQSPATATAMWQIGSTFGLYLASVVSMYACIHLSVWLTIALALPASGLIVRIFMFQHDCGHNSMFRSRSVNSVVGAICSLVTLTPFAYWRRLHARHHGSWNNLDGRGIPADFFSDCMTAAEFHALDPVRRRVYRAVHHPSFIHLLLPPLVFLLLYRVPFDTPISCRRERNSVILLNGSIIGMVAVLTALFGWSSVILVQLPPLIVAAIIGIWLFSVQHRFEDAQWTRKEDWQFASASLHGASYLRLPKLLRWFSANIGLHHVHHLRPGIPNYRLQACHDGCADITRSATILTLRDALKAPTYALWDERLGKMVPFPT